MKKISYGKIEDTIDKIKGLENLIGLKEKNKFGAKNEEELIEKLGDMQLIDLQRLAISVGVPGGGTRQVLKKKIIDAFLKFMKGGTDTSISTFSKMELKGKNKKNREEEIRELLKV